MERISKPVGLESKSLLNRRGCYGICIVVAKCLCGTSNWNATLQSFLPHDRAQWAASQVTPVLVSRILVLGITGCINYRSNDDGSPVQLQTILLEILIDQVKKLIAPIAVLHQVAEPTYSGLVRCCLPANINTD